jgi:peptide/nickel transport system substrate-binding protein
MAGKEWTRREFLGLGAALGLGLAGCAPQQAGTTQGPAAGGDQPRYGGVLTVWTGGDPPNYDLHQNSTYMVLWPLAPCYNLLVQFDPQDPNRIIPDLAERWDVSSDGKIYTFYLKRDVRFHHGKPFKAEDVKASFERIIWPPKGVVSPRQGAFTAVDGIETPDDYTVRFVLKRPNPSLLPNIAQGWNVIYPKDVLEAKGDMKKDVVGTGPFKFKEHVRGVSIELVKNPEYHVEGRPYLDGVKYFIIPDPNTALSAFISGQLLMYRPRLKSDAEEARRQLGDRVVIQTVQSYSFDTLTLNARRKPWDDPRVRLAVSLAIDRNAAIQVLAQGDGVAGGFMPAGGQWALPPEEIARLPGYSPNKAQEIEQARRLLAEAGYPNGFKTTMLTRKGADYEPISVFLKDQLAKVGIDAALDVQESAAAYDRLNQREFDSVPWGHAIALDDPDAVYGEFYLCKSERNYSGICDPEVEALFERQSQTLDPNERKRLVGELEKKALVTQTKIILLWRLDRTIHWSTVRNYRRHPSLYNNQRMQDVWLAEA